MGTEDFEAVVKSLQHHVAECALRIRDSLQWAERDLDPGTGCRLALLGIGYSLHAGLEFALEAASFEYESMKLGEKRKEVLAVAELIAAGKETPRARWLVGYFTNNAIYRMGRLYLMYFSPNSSHFDQEFVARLGPVVHQALRLRSEETHAETTPVMLDMLLPLYEEMIKRLLGDDEVPLRSDRQRP